MGVEEAAGVDSRTVWAHAVDCPGGFLSFWVHLLLLVSWLQSFSESREPIMLKPTPKDRIQDGILVLTQDLIQDLTPAQDPIQDLTPAQDPIQDLTPAQDLIQDRLLAQDNLARSHSPLRPVRTASLCTKVNASSAQRDPVGMVLTASRNNL